MLGPLQTFRSQLCMQRERRLQKAGESCSQKAEAWEVWEGSEYDHRPSLIAAMFLAISKITYLGNKVVF